MTELSRPLLPLGTRFNPQLSNRETRVLIRTLRVNGLSVHADTDERGKYKREKQIVRQ